MDKVLVLGDTHIPDRALRVPPILSTFIEKEFWDYVIFTGDLTSPEVRSWVESLGNRVVLVRGNMDYLPLPLYEKIVIGEIRIGVYHGHGIYPRGDVKGLTKVAVNLQVDLLVSGHTHTAFIKTDQAGKTMFINPGSATGAWSGELESGPPSLMFLEVENDVIKTGILRVSHDLIEQMVFVAEKKDRWIISPATEK